MRGAWSAGLVLLACASGSPSGTGPGASRHSLSELEFPADGEERLLRPDQVFEILEESSIAYSIRSDADVPARSVAQLIRGEGPRFLPIDAYLWRAPGEVDEPARVMSRRPPPDIIEFLGEAGQAVEAGDYETAHVLYAKALERRPNYFKTYTYLGNTLHLLGELRLAEFAFRRALDLNPIDYQALLFLGDTYMQLGDYASAKTVLTRAYMLNRTNEAVQDRLRVTLAKKALRVRPARLNPEVRIERSGEGKVQLGFDRERGLRWLALAACMACWAFEGRCSDRSTKEDDPLRIAMYRECLAHQAVSIAAREARDGGRVLPDERAFLSAIEDGFLPAIVFWEVLAPVAPRVISVLPERLHEEILQYIERYVIVSAAFVERTTGGGKAAALVVQRPQ